MLAAKIVLAIILLALTIKLYEEKQRGMRKTYE